MGQRPDPPVVAIVLNWNSLPDTLECVASLRRSDYSNLIVWVVDNGSREDPTATLEREHPGIRVLRNARNLGYGGGNNRGLTEALAHGATYAVLLNNDTVVAPDTVRRLVGAAEGDGRIAMATPVIFYYDRPTEVYWDGGVVDWRAGDVRHDSRSLSVDDHLVKSEWLDGSVLLVRMAALREIGLLDERYFLYYEDSEWSVRGARRGWTNVVTRTAHAWHKVARSSGGRANPAVRFYYLRNRYLFMKTHHPSRWGLGWRVRHVRGIGHDYIETRHRRTDRKVVIAAFLNLFRARWGPYDDSLTDRRMVAVLDALLLPLRKSADLVGSWLVRRRRAQSLRSR